MTFQQAFEISEDLARGNGCGSCSAKWRSHSDGGGILTHSNNCAYIRFRDRSDGLALADLDGEIYQS